jgi:hypothetical protein
MAAAATSSEACILTTKTLRLPRSLWQDLEETVIQQDRQFLTEVARELGLPVAEVLRRCLGTGALQPVPVLWTNPLEAGTVPEVCPWWECHGEGLWRRCPRLRLASTLPCQIHERCTPCPLARTDRDPVIRALPVVQPVRWQGSLYWINPADPDAPPFHEDGTVDLLGRFRQVTFRGERVWARVSA